MAEEEETQFETDNVSIIDDVSTNANADLAEVV